MGHLTCLALGRHNFTRSCGDLGGDRDKNHGLKFSQLIVLFVGLRNTNGLPYGCSLTSQYHELSSS